MTRAAQTQADVRSILQQRRLTPTEEQFIDEDAFESAPGQPRLFRVAGAELKVWKIHRLGLDLGDVKGADLYYELGDRKFVLIQYKIPNSLNRVRLDDDQLQELQDACPVPCLPTQRFNCGSWYALRQSTGTVYFPACEARRLFGGYASRKAEYFVNGLERAHFQQDFGRCRIGARTQLIDLEEYVQFTTDSDRVLVQAHNRNGGGKV